MRQRHGFALRLLSMLVAATAVLAPAMSSRADDVSRTDPQDMDDWGLDIARVSHRHARWNSGWRLVHTISTYEPWRSRSLRPRCGTGFAVLIKDSRRSVDIFYKNGKLRGRVENARGDFVGRAYLTRPDRRSVRVWIRPRLIGRVGGSYDWSAGAETASCGCDDSGAACPALFDRAPDRGFIRHQRDE